MKQRLLLLYLFTISVNLYACEYGDDIRLQQDPVALIQAIRTGQETDSIKITLETYLGMGVKTRKLLGNNILITSLDCKLINVFDGEIIGKISLPFEEFYRAMAHAIRHNQPEMAKKLMVHGQAAPMPVEQYIDLFAQLPVAKTGGLKIRAQMQQIFPAIKQMPPQKSWLRNKLEQGRMKDYTMARLFSLFGGQLLLDKGCGPYQLSKKLYTIIELKSLFGKPYQRYVTRQDPVHFLLQIMHTNAVFNDNIHYTIKGCTP